MATMATESANGGSSLKTPPSTAHASRQTSTTTMSSNNETAILPPNTEQDGSGRGIRANSLAEPPQQQSSSAVRRDVLGGGVAAAAAAAASNNNSNLMSSSAVVAAPPAVQPSNNKTTTGQPSSPTSPSQSSETISYSAERIIGNGSFGVVFQASVVETGEIVAIKKVLQDKRFKNRELQIMRQLVKDGHSNIVSLKHCFYSQVMFLFVLLVRIVLFVFWVGFENFSIGNLLTLLLPYLLLIPLPYLFHRVRNRTSFISI